MTLPTLGIDAYQLTTLLTHGDEGRLDQQVSMAFFFRRMPKHRSFVVFAGLRRILEHAAQMAVAGDEIEALLEHPVLGPALAKRRDVVDRLLALRGFEGSIDAMPEGSLAFAGTGSRTDGSPLVVAGAPLQMYTPLLQVRTDLVRAKLIETPWLCYANHMSMVASKAARVVMAARGKTVLEFGQRRTHPAAALDASWAAYLAGISATSNVGAWRQWRIPMSGTMDHFAIQASERPDRSHADAEKDFFAAYAKTFDAGRQTMLVDTYDTERGIRHAVEATGGHLHSIRIDSNVTREAMVRARALLAELGSPDTQIFVSDALDEHRVAELVDVVDGFGVGENIVCSPDAATGVGAVAKLVVNGYGRTTMKIARGSGKATLPGELQVWRFGDHDLVALASEPSPGGGARPMLSPVWRDHAPLRETSATEDLALARARAAAEIAALPSDLRTLDGPAPANTSGASRKLVASDALVRQIEQLVQDAR